MMAEGPSIYIIKDINCTYNSSLSPQPNPIITSLQVQSTPTMKPQSPTTSPIFLEQQANPNSLVLLQAPENLLSRLLIVSEKTVYIWVIEPERKGPEMDRKVRAMSERLGSVVWVFAGMGEVEEFIRERLGRNLNIVILKSKKKGEHKQPDLPQPSQPSQLQSYIASTYTHRTLTKKHSQTLSYLQSHKQQQIDNRELPNFVKLDRQVSSSNVQVRSMIAMLGLPGGLGIRGRLVDGLEKLIGVLSGRLGFYREKEKELAMFVRELREGQLQPQRAIYLYTLQSPIYSLTNNLLRSTSHPAQIFYIQPFFKDLFNAVRSLCREQGLHQQEKEQIFYRGGTISEAEVEQLKGNLGGVVQNLGFFSTSEKEGIAMGFKKNVVFQVIVPPATLHPNAYTHCTGFAKISEHSTTQKQHEVLFNPLNSFKILSVHQHKENPHQELIWKIRLSYGELSRLLTTTMDEKALTQEEKMYRSLARLQEEENLRIACQGNVLVDQSQGLEGGELYWERYGKLARSFQEKEFGLYYQALIKKHAGHNDKAIKLYNEYLTMIKQKQGTNNLKYADGLNNLALVYQSENKPEKALDLYTQAMKTKQKLLGISHIECAQILSNIAAIYKNKNEFQKSLQYYKETLKIQKEVLGEYHPDYAATMSNYAVILDYLGRMKEAVEYYRRSIEIMGKTLGEDHIDYAATLNNLGLAYQAEGDLERALEILKRSLKIKEKALGKGHHDCVLSHNNIGSVYLQLENPEEAVKCYERSLEIQENRKDHPDYAGTLSGIAAVLMRKGDLSAAKTRYEEALSIMQHCNDSISCSLILSNLALIEKLNSNYQSSIIHYKRATEITKEKLGHDHPDHLELLKDISKVYEQQKNYKAARDSYTALLKIQGVEHPDYLATLEHIGDLFRLELEYKQALIIYKECLKIVEKRKQAVEPLKAKIQATRRLAESPRKVGR